jgi:hypothetical protein
MMRILSGVAAAVVSVVSIAGCSGAGSANGVPRGVADSWSAKWCQAAPGNTKAQLVALMGEPTGKSDTTMTWSAYQYQFNAFLDPDGTVNQLDVNPHSLSDAEQAAFTCAKVRTRESMALAARMAKAAAKAAGKPARPSPVACSLVSEAEMSAILGAPVVTDPNLRSGTKCIYKATTGISPYVELSVDIGDAKVAMGAMGTMAKAEPGLTNPYDGIGDQAAAVGPALMIRTGDDLVTIVFSGVSDAPAKAKRIFDTAKSRM